MTPATLLFHLACLLLGETARTPDVRLSSPPRPEGSLVSAAVGSEVTLRCFYDGQATRLYWFKQALGQKPRIISSLYKFTGNGTFYNEFKNNPRFRLDTEKRENTLKIVDVEIDDSATYYCASAHTFDFEFEEGVTVSVRGSGRSVRASVLQSESGSVPPGRSVTLSCTASTSRCDGEHAVYWFRHADAPQPGLIYRSGRCESDGDTQTRVCVLDLPLDNVTRAHAGTYYCAVSLCGRVVFGNGTRLDVGGQPASVYFLSAALALTTVVSAVSTSCACAMRKRNKSRENRAGPSSEPTGSPDEDNLHYAAIRTNRTQRPRKERRGDECVYSSVKHQS